MRFGAKVPWQIRRHKKVNELTFEETRAPSETRLSADPTRRNISNNHALLAEDLANEGMTHRLQCDFLVIVACTSG